MDLPRGRFGARGAIVDEDDIDEEDLEETLSERLWGLTEMFPEKVRSAAGATSDATVWAAKSGFKLARSMTWLLGTSILVLLFPVLFEKERLDVEQVQVNQQRQMLLGPGAAISGAGASKGGMGGVMGMMPGK